MAARFEIICTYVLGLACKGATILEINKRTMKMDNIRKLVRTSYVTNVYKKRDCPGSVANFFFLVLKISRHIFLTVGREIANITFLARRDYVPGERMLSPSGWRRRPRWHNV